MKKQLLTVEFRYTDAIGERPAHETKTVTVGIYDTLEEAVVEGNKLIGVLSHWFEVRADDRFEVNSVIGPKRLVTNTCYHKGVQYFAKITALHFDNMETVIDGAFSAASRYAAFKNA